MASDQTTEYLAYYLLQNYGSSAEIKGFVDKYDFYIFPVVNPDGMFASVNSDREAFLTLSRLRVHSDYQSTLAQESSDRVHKHVCWS